MSDPHNKVLRPTTADRERLPSVRTISIVLIIFAISSLYCIQFAAVARRPLAGYDEAIYAQVAREALSSKSPLSFTWSGNIGLGRGAGWYEKPPVMIWLTELAFVTFGRNDLAARLWVLLFSIATIALLCLWVNAVTRSTRAVILAASVFCVSLQFLLSSSVLQLDIPVGFFILLAVFSFARGRHDERYFGLFWLSIGFGVMTKSVIGLLPLPIALIGAMMTNDHSYLRSRWFRFGVLLLLAVAVPWHLAETVLYGKAFWEQYVVYHLLTRWSTAIEGNGQPFLFYWQIIARQRLLFWVFAPSMIYVAYRGVKGDLDSALFGAACVVIFAFFTSSHTKLPGYILPIYPYMAGCVGVFFAAAFEALDPWAADGIAALIVIVCCFVGIRYMSYQQRVAHADQFAIDNRAVGAFLGNNYHSMDAYYLSESGTAPTIIYYADRIIYWLNFGAARPESSFILISTEPPPFYPAETVFKTPTEAVYLVQ